MIQNSKKHVVSNLEEAMRQHLRSRDVHVCLQTQGKYLPKSVMKKKKKKLKTWSYSFCTMTWKHNDTGEKRSLSEKFTNAPITWQNFKGVMQKKCKPKHTILVIASVVSVFFPTMIREHLVHTKEILLEILLWFVAEKLGEDENLWTIHFY